MAVNFDFIKELKNHKSLQSGKIKFLIVTKNQSIEDIQQLLDKGHRLFGENRVQEATQKFEKIQFSQAYKKRKANFIIKNKFNRKSVNIGIRNILSKIL